MSNKELKELKTIGDEEMSSKELKELKELKTNVLLLKSLLP